MGYNTGKGGKLLAGEKKGNSDEGGAAAAWRQDRFRVSPLFFFTLQTAPLPFVNFPTQRFKMPP